MIDYTLFSFACPPGVGAEWFVKAAELCGLGWHDPQWAHEPFNGQQTNRLKVSLVRNPCTWLVNCYDRLRSANGKSAELLTLLDGSLELDSFVSDYVRRAGGALGRIASRYEADTVLRIEDMPWAFVELMDLLGAPKAMRNRVAKLDKPDLKTAAMLSHYQAKTIAAMERELMNRYEYFA